jgi:2-amino-4-hydroxy-6-hydroxymethyldihydropteridine diphosphokinase
MRWVAAPVEVAAERFAPSRQPARDAHEQQNEKDDRELTRGEARHSSSGKSSIDARKLPTEPPFLKPLTVIGVGANLGDRKKSMEAAIFAIAALPGVEIVARSSIWRTAPVGGPPQPDFFNAAIAVRTFSPPEELMAALLGIEERLGRVRTERNAPRLIDLDLLWREGAPVRIHRQGSPEVEIPHPRLHERAFALAPLVEVAPSATDPKSGKPYAAILDELGRTGIAPLDSSEA